MLLRETSSPLIIGLGRGEEKSTYLDKKGHCHWCCVLTEWTGSIKNTQQKLHASYPYTIYLHIVRFSGSSNYTLQDEYPFILFINWISKKTLFNVLLERDFYMCCCKLSLRNQVMMCLVQHSQRGDLLASKWCCKLSHTLPHETSFLWHRESF